MGFSKPFKVGSLELSSNVFCSPLAGCSDFPFRKIVKKYRPGLVFCEMVKMDALIRNDPNTYRILDYDASMHPLGAQIVGSKPKLAGPCAKIIEDLGFDLIDLNCGCPVDKVTKDQSGSGLLKTPELIGEILSNMVSAVKIPVTVKVRAGWDEESINAPLITQIAEKAGAQIIFVHGRTRKQAYKGPANWDYIKECKSVSKSIFVFGNGDIKDAESAEKIFSHTGCDGILLSRGTFGSPWIFEEIERHFMGLKPITYDTKEIRRVLIEHIYSIIEYQQPRKALLDLRRISSWYCKKETDVKYLRELAMKAQNLDEVVQAIEHEL